MKLHGINCCFHVVLTCYFAINRLKFGVLIYLIIAPLKNRSKHPVLQLEGIRYYGVLPLKSTVQPEDFSRNIFLLWKLFLFIDGVHLSQV